MRARTVVPLPRSLSTSRVPPSLWARSRIERKPSCPGNEPPASKPTRSGLLVDTTTGTSTDHDLADHPVWPVVAGLGAADLIPDDDHRYDLDGVYDIAAENPDRWAVEELAATVDIVRRLAEGVEPSVR